MRRGGRYVGQDRVEGEEASEDEGQGMPRRARDGREDEFGARDVTQQGPRVRCKFDLGSDGTGVMGLVRVLDEV